MSWGYQIRSWFTQSLTQSPYCSRVCRQYTHSGFTRPHPSFSRPPSLIRMSPKRARDGIPTSKSLGAGRLVRQVTDGVLCVGTHDCKEHSGHSSSFFPSDVVGLPIPNQIGSRSRAYDSGHDFQDLRSSEDTQASPLREIRLIRPLGGSLL